MICVKYSLNLLIFNGLQSSFSQTSTKWAMSLSRVSKVVVGAGLTVVLQACSYSIIVVNKNGVPQPDPLNRTLGFYNGKQVAIIDTVVPLSALQDGVTYVDSSCVEGGFHSVEYKITFGDMLRNTFTAGKRKAVRVKLVCIKPSN